MHLVSRISQLFNRSFANQAAKPGAKCTVLRRGKQLIVAFHLNTNMRISLHQTSALTGRIPHESKDENVAAHPIHSQSGPERHTPIRHPVRRAAQYPQCAITHSTVIGSK
jgi:hypothetical protein